MEFLIDNIESFSDPRILEHELRKTSTSDRTHVDFPVNIQKVAELLEFSNNKCYYHRLQFLLLEMIASKELLKEKRLIHLSKIQKSITTYAHLNVNTRIILIDVRII